MNPKHNAFAAAKEFARNVMGDVRILRRELQNDPESHIALEETARFLGQLSQEMLAAIATRTARRAARRHGAATATRSPTTSPTRR
jgi:hypothetical protein